MKKELIQLERIQFNSNEKIISVEKKKKKTVMTIGHERLFRLMTKANNQTS